MSVSAMKQALKAFNKIYDGCGEVKKDNISKHSNDLATLVRKDCNFAIANLSKAIAEAEDAVAAEREACAKVCEDLIGTRAMARHCADSIRARGEWVKTYCGGKPNYTTPADDDIYDVWVEQELKEKNVPQS